MNFLNRCNNSYQRLLLLAGRPQEAVPDGPGGQGARDDSQLRPRLLYHRFARFSSPFGLLRREATSYLTLSFTLRCRALGAENMLLLNFTP